MNGDKCAGRGRGRGRLTAVEEEGRGRGQRGRGVGARNRAVDVELEVEPFPVRAIFAFEAEDAEGQQEEPEVGIDMEAVPMEDQAPVVEEQKMEEEEDVEPAAVQRVSRELPHGIVEATEKTSGLPEMIKQYLGKMRPFRVVQSFGPDEFYIIEEKDVASILQKDDGKLYQEFQAAMNKAEWDEIIGVTRALRMTPQECFAYQETHGRQWCRVQLLKTFTFDNVAPIGFIYFLDLDSFQYVPLADLRQLPGKFATGLARIFKCFLENAVPVNSDSDDESLSWSKEAVEYFNELVMGPGNEGKTVNVLAVKCVEEPGGKIADAGYSLGVILFLGSSGEQGAAMTSVGWKMIEKGYADEGHHHT